MKLYKNIFLAFILVSLSIFLVGCPVKVQDDSQTQDQEQIQQFQNIYFNYPVRDKFGDDTLSWDNSTNDFGHYLPSFSGFHPGEDYNLPGETDNGMPVYSIGRGKVIYVSPKGLGGLGYLVVIEHTGNFVIPAPSREISDHGQAATYEKEVVDRIYSVYLHINLAEIDGKLISKDVEINENNENQPIGYIMKPENMESHLHLEIRKSIDKHSNNWSMIFNSHKGEEITKYWQYDNGTPNGYYTNLQEMVDVGLRDPSDFIEANMIGSKIKIGSPQTISEESISIESDIVDEETSSKTINIIKENPWPMLYHDPKFTKRTSYKGPDNPVEMWQLKFKNIFSNPVVDYNGTIYIVAVKDNRLLLFAVESIGKIKWSYNLNQTNETVDLERFQCYLALEKDDLIILSSSWGLSGISTNGTLLWSANIGDCNYRCPIVDENGNIYIVTNAKNSIEYADDMLYCISKDGSINWQVDLKKYYNDNDFPVGSPDLILNDNSIYIGNGFTKIELQNNNSISNDEPFFLNYSDSAIGYQNRIIFPCWESSLIYFMDFPSFNQIWNYNTQGFVFRPSISNDGTVYFNAYNYDDISALSYLYSAKKNGGLNWSLELPSGVFPQMTIDSDGIVYLSVSHKIYAIYPDGSKKWVYEISSDGNVDQPIIGINNMLYFITGIWNDNSILHAIGSKG